MRKEFLPFTRPSISEAEIQAVGDVLRSGWITTGPRAAEFEKKFSEFTGCAAAVSVSSATGGMHVALKALGIGPGDEVLTPSLTWVSTINLIVLAGARPVFVDVDPETLMASPEAFAEKVTPATKLAIPVHFAGAPAESDRLRELMRPRGVTVLDDAAHAAGTMLRGKRIGADGSAVFSFHAIKNLTTAEGGMVTSGDAAFLDRVRMLKFHGLGVDAFDRQTQGRSPQAEVLEPGYKYNMTDISAVLGLGQLRRLEEMNARRKALAAYYFECFAGIEEIRPLGVPQYPHEHAWHLFVVRVLPEKAKLTREEFMAELKSRNIGTGLHFRAAHLQKYYLEKMGCRRGMLPATEWNSDRICSLPLFPDMTERDIDDVIGAIKETLAARR